jgi:Fe-S cluster biogenesis protein NfuA
VAAAPQNLRAVGDRIEVLLDELGTNTDERTAEKVFEVVRLVTELYGGGLARVVELGGPDLLDRLAGDELVASLLVLHGLHPQDLPTRVEGALDEVRPFLATHGGDVELLGVDGEEGVVHLRMLGSCDGCPSSSVTLELAVQRAIGEAAPEIVHFEVEAPTTAAATPAAGVSTPIALTSKPPVCPTEVVEAAR